MYLHIVQYNLHQSWGLSHNARKGIGLAAKAVETHGTCGVFVANAVGTQGKRRCLCREGSGKTRKSHYLSREGGTHSRGTVFAATSACTHKAEALSHRPEPTVSAKNRTASCPNQHATDLADAGTGVLLHPTLPLWQVFQ